jgi:predicted Zn-dependent protease
MKSYLTALLLFLPFLSGAQDLASYELIHCSGKVPADFTTRTGSKVNQDISEQLSDGDTRKAKQTKSDFLLHSNYMVDELLMSGSVLFGDPVTNYVNSVVDVILAHDPELRKKLRFYCIKSNTVNAFCTNQGMIFVTLGLISKLDNEAQLAYILCHEISHYTENHVINSYIEAEKIFNQDEKNRNIGYEGNIAKLSSYSRQVELQADSLGLELLMRSSYSVEEALTALEKL